MQLFQRVFSTPISVVFATLLIGHLQLRFVKLYQFMFIGSVVNDLITC